jgi:hypothetical protein
MYKTIVQPYCHSQCVELSQVRQRMSTEMDMCTVIGAACRLECVKDIDWGVESDNSEETDKGASYLFS